MSEDMAQSIHVLKCTGYFINVFNFMYPSKSLILRNECFSRKLKVKEAYRCDCQTQG